MRALLASVTLLVACTSETILSERATCDGIVQNTEDGVDEPFDRDGDGFFDAANPDCAETYPADALDCNDANADIYPGAPEVLCNQIDDDCAPSTPDDPDSDGDGDGVCSDCDDDDELVSPSLDEVCNDGFDNNCDDQIDEDCDDPSGVYLLDQTIRYTCAGGAVSMQFDQLVLELADPLMRVTSLGSAQPGQMDGDIRDGAFYVERVINGTCNETYTLQGVWQDEDTFLGSLDVSFAGFLCLNCQPQSYSFTADKQ
jgi:hypothetical protein